MRGRAVREYGRDRRGRQDASDISGDHIADTAVGRTDDVTACDHIPYGNVVTEQKCLFLRDGDRAVIRKQQSEQLPEAVLRVSVIKLLFPGFDGRKASEDQDVRSLIKDRGKGVCDVFISFHGKNPFLKNSKQILSLILIFSPALVKNGNWRIIVIDRFSGGRAIMQMETLQKDMIAAMKAKDKVRKEAISSLVSAVKKNAIDAGCRDDIKEDLVDRTVLKELNTVKEQLDTCPADRTDLKEQYQARYDIISEYAPKLMSAEEVEKVLTEEFADVLASGNKGQIMKEVMPKLRGKADGKVINQIVAKLCAK